MEPVRNSIFYSLIKITVRLTLTGKGLVLNTSSNQLNGVNVQIIQRTPNIYVRAHMCGLSHARQVVVLPPDRPDRFEDWGVRNLPDIVSEITIGRLGVA